MKQELIETSNISNELILLNEFIKNNKNIINSWIETKRGSKKWPIYHSLDLRNSGYKICHVDSNLFPAGFNNLSNTSINNAIQEFKEVLHRYQRILIIIEHFTRNIVYIYNILQLKDILTKASNAEIKFATLGIDANTVICTNDVTIELHALKKSSNLAYIQLSNSINWYPDFILLNNDLTSGISEELQYINQDMLPNPQFGWHSRKKSEHFKKYNKLIIELSQLLKFNPFLVSTYIDTATNINFRNKTGLNLLQHKAEKLLKKIQHAYKANDIKLEPYLFLKADKGTFGMGVLEFQDIKKILTMNKKHRHSMHLIKGGILNDQILIQEGIATTKLFASYPAENIIYSVNGSIVGEMIRYNTNKNSYQSLNSSGMKFIAVDKFNIEMNLGYIKWLINKITNLICCL